jgi:predicted dithiol-disulfide oxidoreductase (DUF899 family)
MPGHRIGTREEWDAARAELLAREKELTPGLEVVMGYYGILDRVPRGRDEHEPEFSSWMRHRDRYRQASGAATGA